MGYIGGWNSQQKLNRICWNLGGEFCLRLFNFVSHQQRERERKKRESDLFFQKLLKSIRENRPSHGSCCGSVNLEEIFNIESNDEHEDFSRFFDGLNLAVAS